MLEVGSDGAEDNDERTVVLPGEVSQRSIVER